MADNSVESDAEDFEIWTIKDLEDEQTARVLDKHHRAHMFSSGIQTNLLHPTHRIVVISRFSVKIGCCRFAFICGRCGD